MSRQIVDVCITTFHRPAYLAGLLDSLAAQQLPADTALRIIVVDNDRNGSARAVAEARAREMGLDLVYVIEPVQGISHARNRALGEVQAPFMAFLDDDEWVAPDWLANLLATMQAYTADVVAGPVNKQIPVHAPAWVRQHPAYADVIRPSGTQLEHCDTGNVMIRMAALGQPRLSFHADFAHTGGEDLEFFSRLRRAGKKIVWCAEALAFEHVPDERLKLGWILKRQYRSGQVYYRVLLAGRGLWFRAKFILLQLAIIVLTTPLLPLLALVSFPQAVRYAGKQAKALGKLTAALGGIFLYKEYQGQP